MQLHQASGAQGTEVQCTHTLSLNLPRGSSNSVESAVGVAPMYRAAPGTNPVVSLVCREPPRIKGEPLPARVGIERVMYTHTAQCKVVYASVSNSNTHCCHFPACLPQAGRKTRISLPLTHLDPLWTWYGIAAWIVKTRWVHPHPPSLQQASWILTSCCFGLPGRA